MVPRWSYRALMMVALTPFALAATVPVNAAEPTPVSYTHLTLPRAI